MRYCCRNRMTEHYVFSVLLSVLFLSFLCACHRGNVDGGTSAAISSPAKPGTADSVKSATEKTTETSTIEKPASMEDKWAESIRSDYRSWKRPEKAQPPAVFASSIVYEDEALALPPPAKANELLPASRMYKVKQGDTLWGIAEKMYGKGWLWRKIYEANLDRLRNPSRIRTGLVLEIPGGDFKVSVKTPVKKENNAK